MEFNTKDIAFNKICYKMTSVGRFVRIFLCWKYVVFNGSSINLYLASSLVSSSKLKSKSNVVVGGRHTMICMHILVFKFKFSKQFHNVTDNNMVFY